MRKCLNLLRRQFFHEAGLRRVGISFRQYALIGAAMVGLCSPAVAGEVVPIPSLDVPRYMGVWYEVAKYPNAFQAKCIGDTSAAYTLQTGGTVQVVNRCRSAGGDMIEAVGEARSVDGADSAKLEVRFAPEWLSWLPMVWGDYWVVDLDVNYRLAAVGEPTRKYLWILSRTPKADPAAYRALLGRLEAQGFDTQRLETTRQHATMP